MARTANYKGPGQPGHWYGYQRPKANRRPNGANPRKQHPYVTKDQLGTPIEYMIRNLNAELEDQYNAMRRGPGVMSANEASGRLGTHWGNVKRRMTDGRAVASHIRENGGSVGKTRNFLVGLCDVRFGSDPKSR